MQRATHYEHKNKHVAACNNNTANILQHYRNIAIAATADAIAAAIAVAGCCVLAVELDNLPSRWCMRTHVLRVLIKMQQQNPEQRER